MFCAYLAFIVSDDSQQDAVFCWSLAAIWPFTLIGLSTGVASESVAVDRKSVV